MSDQVRVQSIEAIGEFSRTWERVLEEYRACLDAISAEAMRKREQLEREIGRLNRKLEQLEKTQRAAEREHSGRHRSDDEQPSMSNQNAAVQREQYQTSERLRAANQVLSRLNASIERFMYASRGFRVWLSRDGAVARHRLAQYIQDLSRYAHGVGGRSGPSPEPAIIGATERVSSPWQDKQPLRAMAWNVGRYPVPHPGPFRCVPMLTSGSSPFAGGRPDPNPHPSFRPFDAGGRSPMGLSIRSSPGGPLNFGTAAPALNSSLSPYLSSANRVSAPPAFRSGAMHFDLALSTFGPLSFAGLSGRHAEPSPPGLRSGNSGYGGGRSFLDSSPLRFSSPMGGGAPPAKTYGLEGFGDLGLLPGLEGGFYGTRMPIMLGS